MPRAGAVWIDVLPNMSAFQTELRRQLGAPVRQASQDAGEESGAGFGEKFKGALEAVGLVEAAHKTFELVGDAFKDAIEQSNIERTLQAQLGATPAQAAKYGAVAGKLYASGVSGSFDEAVEAIRNTAQSGLLPPGATEKQLQRIATRASDVANTFGQDFEGVTNAATRLIAGGLVKNSGQAFDLITRGFQVLGPKADDLLDTFNEYSVQFQKMGLSGQTSLGLIDQGIKAGARDTDLVADAIKEFSIRAVDGSQTTTAGFKGLGLSAKGMAEQIGKGGKSASDGLQTVLDRLRGIQDPVKRSQLAVDLFGTQAEDLGKALYALDPSKAVSAIGSVGGAADRMGKALRSGPTYELQTFQRTVQQDIVTFLGGTVLPILTTVGGALQRVLAPAFTAVSGAAHDFSVGFSRGIDAIGSPQDRFAQFGAIVYKAFNTARTAVRDFYVGFTQGVDAIDAPQSRMAQLGAIAYQVFTQVKTIASGALTGVVIPALVAFGGALHTAWTVASSVFGFLREAGTWLIPVGIAIAGLTLAINASRIATAATELVFDAYRITIAAWTAVTEGASVAQAAFNLVMDANPVVLVITAIVALGAAIVVAYQRVGWFRAAVQGAWAGIQTAASYAWNSVLKPAFAGFMTGLRAIGTAAMWLWTNGISPAFRQIATIGQWMWGIYAVVVIGPIIGLFKLLAFTATWLYTNAVAPAFRQIGTIAVWLYQNVIQPQVAAAITVFHALGAAATWLYQNAILPTFHAIASAAVWLYQNAIRPNITAAEGALHALGSAASWLYHSAILPAWHGIASVISGVFHDGIQPVFHALSTAVHAIGGAFSDAAGAVGTAWRKIESATKTPINWVINTVWNKGVVPLWAKVASWIPGVPKLGTLHQLAVGGAVRGPGTGTSDSVPALLSNGEHVWTAAEVRAAGGHGAVAAMRASISGAPARVAGGGHRYALGGGVVDALKGAGDLIAHPSQGLAKLLAPVLGKLSAITGSTWGKAMAGLPRMAVAGLKSLLGKSVSSSGIEALPGAGVQRWAPLVSQVLAQLGLAPGLLGKVLSQMSTESGGNPTAINLSDINAQHGDPSRGPMQVIGSTFNAYAGPYKGRGIYDPLANIFAALNYAEHRYGKDLSALGHGHGYASGTPSATRGLAWVGERGPELVDFRGGETVYPHGVSMTMAGAPRGYAAGTSDAERSARASIRNLLGNGWLKELESGTAKAIASAVKNINVKVQAAGGSRGLVAAEPTPPRPPTGGAREPAGIHPVADRRGP